MDKRILDAGRLVIVEHEQAYDVQISSNCFVRNFTIDKRGYNELAASLRLALDVIEHIEKRR